LTMRLCQGRWKGVRGFGDVLSVLTTGELRIVASMCKDLIRAAARALSTIQYPSRLRSGCLVPAWLAWLGWPAENAA